MSDYKHALRVHIRALLQNYVLEHLTSDYQVVTANSVNLVLDSLTPVPEHDSNSLLMPVEPFDKLKQMYKLGTIPAYDEPFHVPRDVDVSGYLRGVLGKKAGKVKSARVVEEDGPEYTPVAIPGIILTRRAREQTPRLGSNTFFGALPASFAALKTRHGLTPVDTKDVEDTILDPDQLLSVTYKLDSSVRSEVSQFMKSVSTMCRPPPDQAIKYLDFSGRSDPPSLDNLELFNVEIPFEPIFPRSRRPGHGVRPPNRIGNFKHLRRDVLEPVELSDEEEELRKETMRVVDGWQTIDISSSPAQSTPRSSQEDQLEEMFLRSSPNTEIPEIAVLEKAREEMDIPLVPRNKTRSRATRPKLLGEGKTIQSFLLDILPREPKIAERAASPAPSFSLLAQPPSAFEADADEIMEDLRGLYGNRIKGNPNEVVMKEQLDDMDELLVDTPDLLPPNVHASPQHLIPAKSFKQFVVPTSKSSQGNKELRKPHVFLKKAKGVASLNLELSWVPFTTNTKLPTHMDVADTFSNDVDAEEVERKIGDVLKISEDIEGKTHAPPQAQIKVEDEALDDLAKGNLVHGCDIILSRAERLRIVGTKTASITTTANEFEVDEASSDKENENPRIEVLPEPVVSDDGDRDDFYVPARPTKRMRLDDEILEEDELMDDSGVAFLSDDVHCAISCQENYLLEDSQSRMEDVDPFGIDLQLAQGQMYDPCMDDGFQPLPFDSQSQSQTPIQQAVRDWFQPLDTQPMQPEEEEATLSAEFIEPMPETYDDGVTHLESSALSGALGIETFALLRGRKITVPPASVVQPTVSDVPHPRPAEDPTPRIIPDGFFDKNTLLFDYLSASTPLPSHKYLASLDFLQKQSLIRHLRGLSVDLMERDTLFGAHIIYDPSAAAICKSLISLPSECDTLTQLISEQSWRFDRILLVFEAYPPSLSLRPPKNDHHSDFWAYSPPVIKAVGKLRRNLSLAEGLEEKRKSCEVKMAFGNTPEEVGRFLRMFGDQVDDGGIIWDQRGWLDEELPDEADLAAAKGMNHFAAHVILCQAGVDEFLEMSPWEREEAYGPHIGLARMKMLNGVIRQRVEEIVSSDTEIS